MSRAELLALGMLLELLLFKEVQLERKKLLSVRAVRAGNLVLMHTITVFILEIKAKEQIGSSH